MSLPSNEEWRPVPGYEDLYEVSNHGRLRRADNHRLIAGNTPPGSYTYIRLWRAGIAYRTQLHRQILAAFSRPPRVGEVARHLDGDPTNNQLDNLAWGTQTDNVRDMIRHGSHPTAGKPRTRCRRGHDLAETGKPTIRSSIRNSKRWTGTECLACYSRRTSRRINCPDCGRELAFSSLSNHRRRGTCPGITTAEVTEEAP